MTDQQYVSLVSQGGTPVRLADQRGTPYPTTGYGSLVFSNGATLTNPLIVDPVVDFTAIPNCAVLYTRNRVRVSIPIVSNTGRVLLNAYQTPAASTITIETVDDHGYRTGDSIKVRIGGLQGVTKRAHPGNGTWQITVTGTRTFALNSSVWVSNSVFYHGACFNASETQVDARPPLTEFMDLIDAEGPGVIVLPVGVISFLTKEATNTGLSVSSGCTLRGQGSSASYIFVGDGFNAWPLQSSGTSDIEFADFTILANRQYQGVGGYHAIRCGGATPFNVSRNVAFRRINIFGSAGYGIGLQSNSIFKDYVFDTVTINECDSDGIDTKDRYTSSENYSVQSLRIYNFGLRNYGVDYAPKRLANNPFATTNGLSTVVVTHPAHNAAVGDPATFTGASVFNGVNMNSTFTIISRTANSYTVDTGQVATGTSSGGGSTVDAYVTIYSSGDAGLDCRGFRWNIDDIHVAGDLVGRTGLRLRTSGINGNGSDFSNASNVTVINTSTSSATSTAVYDGALGCNITNVTAKNVSRAMLAVPYAKRGNYSNINVIGCDYGVYIDGEGIKVSNSHVYQALSAAFYVNGGNAPTGGDLGDDAFTTQSGSAVVTVTVPTAGFVAGVTAITFADVAGFNNVDPNGTYTVLSVVDSMTMTFTASTTANATGSGGGSDATWSTGVVAHNATNVIFNGCTSEGSAVGFKADTRQINASFNGCKSVSDTASYQTAGTNARWRSDFFDAATIISLPTAGTTNPTTLNISDSGNIYYVPSAATEQAVVNLPSVTTATVGCRFVFKVRSTQGIKIGCPNGQVRILSVSANAGGTVSTTTLGASVTLECDTSAGWQASSSLGTWANP